MEESINMKKKQQLVYGIHPVLEALEAGKPLDKVMLQRGLRQETLQKVLRHLKKHNTPFQFVPKTKLDRTTGKNHQGLIAFLSPVEYQDLQWLLPSIFEKGETPLILVLDRITDIRNFGAICRSAECAGVHAIVVPEKGSAQINADAIKTSAGALLRIPICRVKSLVNTLKFLADSGITSLAVHEKSERPYYRQDLSIPLAIVMGSEEDGISDKVLNQTQFSALIPMKGETESLNVSVSTAIVLFETLRQRVNVPS